VESLGGSRWAIFHSVSSFSNAGISITPGGMVAFQNYPFPLFVSSFLILAGTLAHTTTTRRRVTRAR
jgi:Trk-type K+ transport system membrane component